MSPLNTVKKVATTTSGSYIMLVGGLFVAVGPWLLSLETWGTAFTPQNLGILLPIIGGIFLSWYGKSPGSN